MVGTISTSYAQVTELWGSSGRGGEYSAGNIYKTDIDGNYQTTVYSFHKYHGRQPLYTKLCKATNGKLYGLVEQGGNSGVGVLFEYDTDTDTYNLKYTFNNTTSGERPRGSLIQATNGKLYGMTNMGGTNDNGTIFEYDLTTDTYTVLHDFENSTGTQPERSLMQASNGKLYGTTYYRGANNYGVLFEYDIDTDTYSKKYDFDSYRNPQSTLIEASEGKLYGVNSYDLYEYDFNTEVYTVKYNFSGSEGNVARGTLIYATNGKLYGQTKEGGANSVGVIYEYDLSTDTYTKKFDFSNDDGKNPEGSIMQANNGKLYGVTAYGGTYNAGVIFEFDITNDAYAVKYHFENIGDSGRQPRGGLIQANNGYIYGLTTYGGEGSSQNGVLFEYNITTDLYTKKFDFDYSENGSFVIHCITQVSNDKIYGVTTQGGTERGVLFEYNPITATLTKKHDFEQSPSSKLTEGNDGKLYGTISNGGTNNKGSIYEYDPATDNFTEKFSFTGAPNLEKASMGLLFASNNKFYSMSQSGGANFSGTIYEYNPATNIANIKYSFPGGANGGTPNGDLIQADNGKIYGVTSYHGANSKGIIFEYDPATNAYSVKVHFDGTSKGATPFGGLVEASNGKLYGGTLKGGTNDMGVIYEYDPNTGVFTKKYDFDETDGNGLIGALTQSSNGKLYGTTAYGGVYDEGVLFEYDYTTNTYTKKKDFDGVNEDYIYSNLVEVSICYPLNITTQPVAATTACQEDPDITYEVVAEGTNLTYQWYFDDSEITDATNSTYVVTTDPANAGTYTCSISKICGDPLSTDNAVLTISSATEISAQPTEYTTICEGEADVELTVVATGSNLSYQWYFESSEITDATNSTYNVVTNSDNSGIYTCSVTGNCGVLSTEEAVVFVGDETAPIPNVANFDAITGECSASVTYTPTATDNCVGTITATTTNPLTYTEQGTYTVTWTYDDGNGNISTQEQIVIVNDITPPIHTAPSSILDACSVSVYTPTTTDACTGIVEATTTTTFPITTQGLNVVTWTFADGNGNSFSVDQNVIIDDIVLPIPNIETLEDIEVECSVDLSTYQPTATDNCIGTINGTTPQTIFDTQGTYTVTWTYDDGNGNTYTQTQTIIIDDVTAPETPTLTEITGECSATAAAPTTTDNCAETITATTTDDLFYDTQGTYTITWTFDDGNGNSIDVEQNVIIEDVTNPTIECVNNQEFTLMDGETVYTISGTDFDATADDNCNIASLVNDWTTTATLDASEFPVGITTVVWTVTDIAGNSEICTFDVQINAFVGISDLSELEISIYPNPTTGIFNIETEGTYEITITDISGKVISQFQNFKTSKLDLTENASGVYFIKFQNNKIVKTLKIIKE